MPSSSSRVLRARGTEAPEGTMWAHQANHFFNYCGHRVSRSMVEKAGHDSLGVYGDHCDKRIFDTPEPRPMRIPTWAESEREEIIEVERRYPSSASSSSSGSTTAVNTPSTEVDAFLDDTGKGKGPEIESVDLKLDEHIDLPDFLIVHDPQGCTSFQVGHRSSSGSETRYCLVTTKPKNSNPTTTAYLRFSSHRPGKVHRASIRLPNTTQELSIMAKLAVGSSDLTAARTKLECEATMYATCFPRYLSEDWSGYHYIREAEYDGDGVLPVCAVVPKFYGYYVPENRVDTMLLSPILLFEDCGEPVDVARLNQRERSIIFSFWHRLHRLNIAHGSISSYSILAQPGPLHRHPLQRSMSSPSFRLINFGDAVHRKQVSITEWQAICFEELEKVKDLVYGKFYLKSVPRKLPGYEVGAREYWTEHEDVYRYVERASTGDCI